MCSLKPFPPKFVTEGLMALIPIMKPFEFEKWSEFVNISKTKSQQLLKNPTSYTKKLSTKMKLNMKPLTITKVDPDKNVN